jgi:DNA adenine methylase
VYNDLHGNLFNLFRCVKERPFELLEELGFLPLCSRDEFLCLLHFLKKQKFDDTFMRKEMVLAERYLEPLQVEEVRDILTKNVQNYDVKRAAAYFKVLRYSYGSGGTSYVCQGIDIRKFFHLIEQASRRLAKTNLENQPFDIVILHYDRKGVFFYLDPPYVDAEDYPGVVFLREDHVKLRDILKNIKGYFLLSYNDCEIVRELYKDFYIVEVERLDNLAQSANPGKIYKELLIANYDLNNEKEIMPLQMGLFDFQEVFS